MVAVFTFSAFILGLAICGVLQRFVEQAESRRSGGGTAGQRGTDKSGVSIVSKNAAFFDTQNSIDYN